MDPSPEIVEEGNRLFAEHCGEEENSPKPSEFKLPAEASGRQVFSSFMEAMREVDVPDIVLNVIIGNVQNRLQGLDVSEPDRQSPDQDRSEFPGFMEQLWDKSNSTYRFPLKGGLISKWTWKPTKEKVDQIVQILYDHELDRIATQHPERITMRVILALFADKHDNTLKGRIDPSWLRKKVCAHFQDLTPRLRRCDFVC